MEGDETLCPGDHIRVGPLGRAAVQLADEMQTMLRLDERTTLSFPPRGPEASPWLDLVQGVMHFITRVPRRLKIHTPFVNAAVEGTEVVLRVGEAEAELTVFEGRVRFENAAGALVVASREAALARAGEVPVRRVLVKPREAVEWGLHYPPLIDLQLIERVVHVLSREPQALTMETPMVTAYVEGTEFVLGVTEAAADLWVFEGRVRDFPVVDLSSGIGFPNDGA